MLYALQGIMEGKSQKPFTKRFSLFVASNVYMFYGDMYYVITFSQIAKFRDEIFLKIALPWYIGIVWTAAGICL